MYAWFVSLAEETRVPQAGDNAWSDSGVHFTTGTTQSNIQTPHRLPKTTWLSWCQQERLLPPPPYLVPIEKKDGDLESCGFTSFVSCSGLPLQDTHVLACPQHILHTSSCKKIFSHSQLNILRALLSLLCRKVWRAV